MRKKDKIIVVIGPTASGKSDLAVRLARTFDGEVISADSRQVYKGLDLGSGKITQKQMCAVPHHLLDIASPKRTINVSTYQKLAKKALSDIVKRKKVPIICGGTAFYISALVDNKIFPNVEPNIPLRKQLSKKSTDELFSLLHKLDPDRAATIDAQNPSRLIRAIEIAQALGMVPALRKQKSTYDCFFIGIATDDVLLKKKILKRIYDRLKKGMLEEAAALHKQGLSWKRLEELGLEYRYLSRVLRGQMNVEKMTEELFKKTWQYVKRQRTWWKHDTRIHWYNPAQFAVIKKEVQRFLKQ